LPTLSKTQTIESEFLIVAEGGHDAAFFKYLCEARGIGGVTTENVGGNGKFESYFKGFSERTGLRGLKALVVAADCEESPEESFKTVRKALKKANLPYPDQPLQIAQRQDYSFAVAVMMIPFIGTGPTRGCLETLLLESASERLVDQRQCVNDFCGCMNVASWPNAARDKFAVRAYIAASWRDDPNLSLVYAVSPEKNLIPLGHSCFNGIATFLRQIADSISLGERSRTPGSG